MRWRWDHLSKRRKLIWGSALIWCALHLLGIGGAILLAEEYNPDELRGWSDIVAYLDAGNTIRDRAQLYELDRWEDPMTYYYHPLFALVFSSVVTLPFRLVAFVWILIQIGAYLVALVVWYRVLGTLNLTQARRTYRSWLPLAIVFTEWIVNLVYGNLTSMLLLLSGLLTLMLWQNRSWRASLIALPILLVKPQWLFPFILPVVMRRWRVLFTALAGLLLTYALANGVYILAVGPDYGTETLRNYVSFLTNLNTNYEWGGHTYTFENMNHSWQQILLSYVGNHAWVPAISNMIKGALVALTGILVLRAWRRETPVIDQPQIGLWFVGLGYLLAMAMLAQLWEIMGSIVFFMAVQIDHHRGLRILSFLYLVYALYEIPALIGFLIGWNWLVLPQSIPLTMIALLALYGILFVLINQSLKLDEGKISS